MKIIILVCMPVFFCFSALASFDFVILKYKSGDYYNARAGVGNFLIELKKRTTIDVNETPIELSLEDENLFNYYFLFLNGHVPIQFSEKEKLLLRRFVLNGGFLFANDDYGMDESFRKVIKEVFPDYNLIEIDFNHPVYHIFYNFNQGLPKIHEHYEGAPRAYGIFINGRLAVFYDYNSDIADGWDSPEVHNDPPEKREAAFKMGINIVIYSLSD